MIGRVAAYAWASPNSLLGFTFGLLMILSGARVRCVAGVVEIAGGLAGRSVGPRGIGGPWVAMTLGHVILAADEKSAEAARPHERVHVRQYEIWGPFFLPAYVASSAWQLLHGRRGYRDNWFERQAFDRS